MTPHHPKMGVNPTPEMWVGLKVEIVCSCGMLVPTLLTTTQCYKARGCSINPIEFVAVTEGSFVNSLSLMM
jgi:hypothetical protein